MVVSVSPNPVKVLASIIWSLVTVRPPQPQGDELVDHEGLRPSLQVLAAEGLTANNGLGHELRAYVDRLSLVDPDQLSREEALAFWINMYNAGALILAGETQREGQDSVLRVPGGFERPLVQVAGESLSLNDIEHAKLRRFADPRIHTALVCGSVSCPVLRSEPYSGAGLSSQLDDQLAHFLASGGCVVDHEKGAITLSRVFLWFGPDFARPHRMPAFLPVSRSSVLTSLLPWLEPTVAEWVESTAPRVEFQSYDWGLRCVVR